MTPTNNTPPTQPDAQQPSFEGLDDAICSARFSWRKSVGRWSAPTTYSLYKKGNSQWLAVVQEMKDGWFWYGGGRNTCAEPTNLETAKKEAMAHIKSIAPLTDPKP
jgi:hypothetical protein